MNQFQIRNQRRDTIYVDESGDPGLRATEHNKKRPFFVMEFCYCRDPDAMARQLRSLLLNMHRDRSYPADLNEFKFYPTPTLRKLGYSEQEIREEWSSNYHLMRNDVLGIVRDYSSGVFAGIQDKTTVSGLWTSGNLVKHMFKESLIRHIMPHLPASTRPSITYDRGGVSPKSTKAFSRDVLDSAQHPHRGAMIREIRYADSVRTPGIWAADFVAGAF